MPERLCINCEHFYLDMGSPGYSEWTPGFNARIGCYRSVWEMSNYGALSEFRGHIQKAETCKMFELPKERA